MHENCFIYLLIHIVIFYRLLNGKVVKNLTIKINEAEKHCNKADVEILTLSRQLDLNNNHQQSLEHELTILKKKLIEGK